MQDPLLEQLSNIDSVEAADRVILTLAEEILRASSNQRRKNLREVRKLVDITIRDRLLPALAWDKACTEIQECWSEVAAILLEYAPQDVRDAIGEKTKALFSNLREDLAE